MTTGVHTSSEEPSATLPYKNTRGRERKFPGRASTQSGRLALSQLDAPVHGAHLDRRTTRLADVRPEVPRIETAAHRHLEIGVERAIDGGELDVAAKITGELDDDAAVHRVEVHIGVGVDAAH